MRRGGPRFPRLGHLGLDGATREDAAGSGIEKALGWTVEKIVQSVVRRRSAPQQILTAADTESMGQRVGQGEGMELDERLCETSEALVLVVMTTRLMASPYGEPVGPCLRSSDTL